MSLSSIFKKLLGVEKAALKSVNLIDEKGEAVIVAKVKLHKRYCWICPYCNRKANIYDWPYKNRRWRTEDLGGAKAYIEMKLPRVACLKHGIHAALVPWALPKARFTKSFEQRCTWLARHLSKKATSELLRIDWKTIGSIVNRVVDNLQAKQGSHRFDNLQAIGIDETSYKKRHKYLTVVINHQNGEVIWATKGHGVNQLNCFFDLLSEEQLKSIKLVSADGARWIANVVAKRCPDAIMVMDPFHVVAWATSALDEVRKDAWREAKVNQKNDFKRKRGRPKKGEHLPPDLTKVIKGARFSLWKNPDNLTSTQQAKLETVAISNPRLYRAYLLKENLRLIFHMSVDDALPALDKWLSWARRCRINQFVELGRKIKRHKEAIRASIYYGLSSLST